MGRKLFIVFYFLLSVYIMFNVAAWRQNEMLSWDKGRYYVYIPATFIYHDLGKLDFISRIDSNYHLNSGTGNYAIYTYPITGRHYTKYPVGVALCESPLFLITHFVNKIFKISIPDGFSWLYQISIGLSTIIFTILGLTVINRFLLQYFSPNAVLLTLILIALGTNLYNYTAFDQGMSHTFSFFFFAALIYLTDRWIKASGSINAFLLGIVAGMIVVIRPVNIIVFIVPFIWLGSSWKIWSKRKKLLMDVLLAVTSLLFVLFIQLSYWKYVTGHWVCYSYDKETFNFAMPHIWAGLFSYKKGWFVYTPVALVGIAGITLLWKKQRSFFWSLIIFFVINIYIIFSWHDWSYGGSFGCRPLIESLAVLSIPLCSLLDSIKNSKKFLKLMAYIICFFLVALNIFQTYQFHEAVIDCCNMNKAYYWRVFGRTEISPQDRKLLQ